MNSVSFNDIHLHTCSAKYQKKAYFCLKFSTLRYLLFLVIPLMFAACNNKEVYNHTYTLDDVWSYADSLVFDYNIQDTLMPYDVVLTVQHSDEYAYENLYIQASTLFPDGKLVTNPVSIELANDQGQWVGKCSWQICTAEIEMASHAYFPVQGAYRLVLKQFSRMESLEGLASIQLQIIQSDDKKG